MHQNDKKFNNPIVAALIWFIGIYQATLSPDHGWFRGLYPNGFCKYHPSCSEYAKQSLQQHGIAGILPAMARVLRCNPFTKGGLDLVK